MAEGVGFEPTNGLPHCWFSRPVLSTAQPPLRILIREVLNIFIIYFTQLKFYKLFLIFRFDAQNPLILYMLRYNYFL